MNDSPSVKGRNDIASFVCEDISGVEVVLLDPAVAEPLTDEVPLVVNSLCLALR